MKSMSATDAKNNFGQLMSLLESGPVSITKNGRVVATVEPAAHLVRNGLSDQAIDELLGMFSKGLVERRDVQDETGMFFGDILTRMRRLGLTLPIVRTFERFNSQQRALYEEIFRAQ